MWTLYPGDTIHIIEDIEKYFFCNKNYGYFSIACEPLNSFPKWVKPFNNTDDGK